MGKIKQGILGGFIGKVGTVIGTTWKGRAVMRSIATSVHDPKTAGQIAARERFALISRMTSACTPFIRVGYHNCAGNISEVNAAIRDNMGNGCIQGTAGSYTIDYSRVSLSHGQHVNPTGLTATASTDGTHTVTLAWTDNSSADQTIAASDVVMICLFNPTFKASTVSNGDYERRDQAAALAYPATWSGTTAEVFVATRSADGSLMSATAYLGTVTLQ